MRLDVVVVGAGAAGLLAAAQSAERGRHTLLLEKNRRPGAKILMSGGTRCNITHATDPAGIVEAFGKPGRFLHSALFALGPAELVDWIEAEGVPTKVEETGKIFPTSDKAADVLAALLRRLARSECLMGCEEPLVALTRRGDGFELTTSRRTLSSQKVIVTTGGQSYPGCGTTGDGYRWLADLGHTIVRPRPALTPVTTGSLWVTALRGVTIPDVIVRVVDGRGKGVRANTPLAQARGSFLFTHFGLSGPAVLDVSGCVTAVDDPRTLQFECDFLPSLSSDALREFLTRRAASDGKKLAGAILARLVPRRLADALLERIAMAGVRMAELTKAQRSELIGAIKQAPIPISGTRGFKKAEVTAGGVALDEVDSRTMQSKLAPNLFLAGEILDLDGPIGGYNFQAAFSTGVLAGLHV